jgi:CubicO group peptidase (beta-lactamase class C family)
MEQVSSEAGQITVRTATAVVGFALALTRNALANGRTRNTFALARTLLEPRASRVAGVRALAPAGRAARRLACACALAAVPCSAAFAQDRPIGDPDLRPLLEREVGRYGATGAAIAIVTADSTRVLAGFGRLVEDGLARVTPDNPFGTVGFDDVITALTASILAAHGRIDLRAGVGRYAPDLPTPIAAITMAQLLSHTSGLDDAPELPPRRRPVARVWPNATERALFTQPGAIYSPSGIGYRLARSIMEQVTGSTWNALVNEIVLGPAGMTHTTFDAGRAESLGAVPGHVVSLTSDRPMQMLTTTANPAEQMYSALAMLLPIIPRLTLEALIPDTAISNDMCCSSPENFGA